MSSVEALAVLFCWIH